MIYLDEFDILENSSLVLIIVFFKVRNICATSWSWFRMALVLFWAMNPSWTLCICLNAFPAAGLWVCKKRAVGLALGRVGLLRVVWKGQLGPWQWDAFAAWDMVQSTCSPGGCGPRAVRPSFCCVLPSPLPFPGQAPRVAASGGTARLWEARQDRTVTDRPFACAREGGHRDSPIFRLLGQPPLFHREVCSGLGGGRGLRPGGLWSSSPSPQQSGHLGGCMWGCSLQPRRLPASL